MTRQYLLSRESADVLKLLFMAGMQWGGYQYSWGSAHVLVPLILGAVLLIVFVLWEAYGAKHPMYVLKPASVTAIHLTTPIGFQSVCDESLGFSP
jgi:hypothetical protein